MKSLKKLSLEPYKGTRDFFPKDQFVKKACSFIQKINKNIYGF